MVAPRHSVHATVDLRRTGSRSRNGRSEFKRTVNPIPPCVCTAYVADPVDYYRAQISVMCGAFASVFTAALHVVIPRDMGK